MTKPAKLAIGIGGAGLAVAAAGLLLAGSPYAWICWWTALACLLVAAAYARNRPGLFGKREGRVSSARVLPVLPYLVALRLACWVMRVQRRTPVVSEIEPGLWVGGRVGAADIPEGVEIVVDLICEFSAPAAVRERPGYRSFPVLDGHAPTDEDAFLELLDELAASTGGVLVHCESGRGRAPTAAALLLVHRGRAAHPSEAIEIVRRGRPWASPTASDWRFMERIARRLEERRRGGRREPA